MNKKTIQDTFNYDAESCLKHTWNIHWRLTSGSHGCTIQTISHQCSTRPLYNHSVENNLQESLQHLFQTWTEAKYHLQRWSKYLKRLPTTLLEIDSVEQTATTIAATTATPADVVLTHAAAIKHGGVHAAAIKHGRVHAAVVGIGGVHAAVVGIDGVHAAAVASHSGLCGTSIRIGGVGLVAGASPCIAHAGPIGWGGSGHFLYAMVTAFFE